MSKVVETTFQWTVAKIYKFVGDDALLRWEALGETDSNIHWAYGREADALIENGLPAMLVYSAIGRKAGKSAETIRKSYYTYHFFTDAVREHYCQAPYSVFEHARRCNDPVEVLKYYVEEQCGIDEIKVLFDGSDDPPEKNYSDFPRYLVGAYRQMLGWTNEHRTRGEAILKEFDELKKAEEKGSET